MDIKKFLFQRVLPTSLALTIAGTPGYCVYDSASTGTERLPEFQAEPEPVEKRSALQQLVENPSGRYAIALLSVVNYAENQQNMKIIEEACPALELTRQEQPASLSTEFPDRADLTHLQMKDPSSGNLLSFTMIAHHRGADGFKAIALYEPVEGILIYGFPGFDFSRGDTAAVEALISGKPNPENRLVPAFLKDVEAQIIEQGKEVKHRLVFGHSLGSTHALKMLAELMLQGTKAKMVLLEEFKASQTARLIEKETGGAVTFEALAKPTVSVLHYPGTFVSRVDNAPLGAKTVAIIPSESPGIWQRQEAHTDRTTCSDLGKDSHQAKAIEVSPEIFSTSHMTNTLFPLLAPLLQTLFSAQDTIRQIPMPEWAVATLSGAKHSNGRGV